MMKILICFMALASCAAAVQDLSGKMFTFPEETSTANVRLTAAIQTFSAATVCHRSFTDLTRTHSLFSVNTATNDNEFLVLFDSTKKELTPYVKNKKAVYGLLDYAPNQWHSICTTWASSSGVVQLWLNGQPLTKKYLPSQSAISNPTIVLGQEQDTAGGGFDITQSFVGMMTDVHMWDSVLTACDLYKYMDGKRFTPGNVLNWAAMNLQITGRVLIEDKQDRCKDSHRRR